MLNKNISLLIKLALPLFLVACVSKKQYLLQTEELHKTQQQLNSAVIEQENLKRKIIAAEDSIKQFRIDVKNNYALNEYRLYKQFAAAKDYQNAAQCLQRLEIADSSQSYWVYDSLSFYHYLYLSSGNDPYISTASLYYAKKGLELNPANIFLLELKGKLLAQVESDTAYQIFQNLWIKTGDYTYLWLMTYMDMIVKGDIKKAEATISDVIKNTSANVRMVRIAQLEEKKMETLPAKAAFQFLRGLIQANSGQIAKATKTMEDVLAAAPNFNTAKRYLMELKSAQYR